MDTHEGWPSPAGPESGDTKLSSAASMAVNAQKTWSSFPSVLVWLAGMKSPTSPAWWTMACTVASLYVDTLVSAQGSVSPGGLGLSCLANSGGPYNSNSLPYAQTCHQFPTSNMDPAGFLACRLSGYQCSTSSCRTRWCWRHP